MLRQLVRLLTSLWRPFGGRGGDAAGGGGGGEGAVGREGRDGLLWYRDLGRCAGGEFSMAVVQANQVLEDQSQIESGPFGTFVGVYDGHGGPDAARYVCDHLFSRFRGGLPTPPLVNSTPLLVFDHLTPLSNFYYIILFYIFPVIRCRLYAEISSGPQGVTSDGIRRAFLATEESFITLVSQLWNTQPNIATTGCCCLVGVICQRTLYVANLGDSRVVLGKKVGNTGEIAAISLSSEHNANVEAVRQELKAQHPNDPEIVVRKHGVWRIKGIIQVNVLEHFQTCY
ncbi:hypothetical protein B296_00007735 [Ensete ventricosum]|uniref:protein-serine/threonine phosphatase n=1 Tax=Ensete ventricosum TaxID=4639 RepID=A0A427AXB8_ENSVE|nr:hypothetical protein B296_00007735 [Ensete ventricosum]